MPVGGLIAHLMVKCGGNVHNKGAVEITASSVAGSSCAPRKAADLVTVSIFLSQNESGGWICWDFKVLRIEPRHCTLRMCGCRSNWCHLKSWAVEGSDDRASWTEIDWRENNSDLNGHMAVKTFAVSRSGSFRRIRLRQTGLNHKGNNFLQFCAFKVFGAVAGLQ
jgi:hypothetical protein